MPASLSDYLNPHSGLGPTCAKCERPARIEACRTGDYLSDRVEILISCHGDRQILAVSRGLIENTRRPEDLIRIIIDRRVFTEGVEAWEPLQKLSIPITADEVDHYDQMWFYSPVSQRPYTPVAWEGSPKKPTQEKPAQEKPLLIEDQFKKKRLFRR